MTEENRDELMALVDTSTYELDQRLKMWLVIEVADTEEDYEKIKANLLANQMGIDGLANPLQRDINRHLKRFCTDGTAHKHSVD